MLEIDKYICDNKHQHDLIFASKVHEAQTTNGTVSFNFKHVLSKLKAKFTNTFSGEYDVVVKSVTFDDICNEGDYNFNTGWQDVTRQKNTQPYVYLLNATGDNASDSPITIQSKNNPDATKEKQVGESQAAFVIPFDYTNHSNEKVYLNITIDLMYGEDAVIKDKQLRAELNPNWQMGYVYTYNIELNASTINMNKIEFKVDASIDGWEDGGEANATLQKN